jgi:pyruvate,water dikinase
MKMSNLDLGDKPSVVPISGSLQDVALVGGKARGLAKLIRAGFSVPEGFCVTTDVFQRMLEDTASDASNLDELVARIRDYEVPSDICSIISTHLSYLNAEKFVVRSSSVAEDSPDSSLAGQNLTELNVTGDESVIQSIKNVWASLFDLSGLLYRQRVGVEVDPTSMAVVVQRMVEPSTGGVLFTANPVGDEPGEFVVDASEGSAAGAVEGRLAETYYLNSSGSQIHGDGELLNSDQVELLGEAARDIDAGFGAPKDVEWAFERGSGELYFLQMRDISAKQVTDDQSAQESVWTNTNVGEALPGVATPLTWSIIRMFSQRGLEQAFGTLGLSIPDDFELIGSFRGRIYLNLTQFMHIASGIPILSPETLFSMAGGGGVELVRDIYEEKSIWEFVSKLPVTISKILGFQAGIPIIARPFEQFFDTYKGMLFDRVLPRLSLEDFKTEFDHVDRIFDITGLTLLTASSNFLMSYVLMREVLERAGGTDALEYEKQLVSGLDVESKEPGLALVDLAYLVRESPRLRKIMTLEDSVQIQKRLLDAREHPDVREFLSKLGQFRLEYGHRAAREAELSTARWREDLDFVFATIRGYLQAAHLPTADEQKQRASQQRQSAEEFVASKLPGWILPFFEPLLRLTRHHAELRERLRGKVVETLDLYRKVFLEVGRRMAEAGLIAGKEDVFFLRYDEIRAWFDGDLSQTTSRVRVLVRRAVKASFEKLPAPPRTFILRGSEIIGENEYLDDESAEVPREESGDVYETFSGIAGSCGWATGRARVVKDLDENVEVKPGEILVAPHTDVGWAPLFLTASAVVTGLGGPLSHSCIVAREYGIPTVVNVRQVTERIETGDIVTVDGDNGEVFVRRD